jgi:hypothetical protein
MSAGAKAAGFAGLLRVGLTALPAVMPHWVDALTWLAILTMTVGNVIAILQSNLKRMLAYSAIAHAGYVMLGVIAGGTIGATAVIYYVAVYSIMNLGAFGIVSLMGRGADERVRVQDLAGAGFRHPWLGAAMTVFMLGLAGIPPTAGFIGKLYLFSAALSQGHVALVIVAVLNSVAAVYYYLRPVVVMYMTQPEGEPLETSPALADTVWALVVATFCWAYSPRVVGRGVPVGAGRILKIGEPERAARGPAALAVGASGRHRFLSRGGAGRAAPRRASGGTRRFRLAYPSCAARAAALAGRLVDRPRRRRRRPDLGPSCLLIRKTVLSLRAESAARRACCATPATCTARATPAALTFGSMEERRVENVGRVPRAGRSRGGGPVGPRAGGRRAGIAALGEVRARRPDWRYPPRTDGDLPVADLPAPTWNRDGRTGAPEFRSARWRDSRSSLVSLFRRTPTDEAFLR